MINELLKQSQDLIAILQQENTALKKNNTDLLLEISYQKQQLTTSFKALEEEFIEMIKHPECRKFQATEKNAIRKVMDVLKECKDLNSVNGLAIYHKFSTLKRFVELVSAKKGKDLCYNKSASIYSEGKNTGKISV